MQNVISLTSVRKDVEHDAWLDTPMGKLSMHLWGKWNLSESFAFLEWYHMHVGTYLNENLTRDDKIRTADMLRAVFPLLGKTGHGWLKNEATVRFDVTGSQVSLTAAYGDNDSIEIWAYYDKAPQPSSAIHKPLPSIVQISDTIKVPHHDSVSDAITHMYASARRMRLHTEEINNDGDNLTIYANTKPMGEYNLVYGLSVSNDHYELTYPTLDNK